MTHTKEELAAFLKENDPETLEWLKRVAAEFVPAESFAYVKTRAPIKPLPVRHTAAKLSDDMVQSKLDTIVNELNVLTNEAKSRYGNNASLHICPDGRLVILSRPIIPPYSTLPKVAKFSSTRTMSITS